MPQRSLRFAAPTELFQEQTIIVKDFGRLVVGRGQPWKIHERPEKPCCLGEIAGIRRSDAELEQRIDDCREPAGHALQGPAGRRARGLLCLKPE